MAGRQSSTRPLVIGHRGVSSRRRENSLEAFTLAASDGPYCCDGVELDVHTTVDGQFVVIHDPFLAAGESIATHTLEALRQAERRAGRHLPTLAEAIEVLAGLDVFIEIKSLPSRSDRELLDVTGSAAPGVRTHFHAFDHRIIARLHHLDSGLSLGVLSCSYPVDPAGQARAAGAVHLWQESHLVDAELVARCAADGIGVIAWTVNDAERAGELASLGVWGLCGNWPERLRPASPEG